MLFTEDLDFVVNRVSPNENQALKFGDSSVIAEEKDHVDRDALWARYNRSPTKGEIKLLHTIKFLEREMKTEFGDPDAIAYSHLVERFQVALDAYEEALSGARREIKATHEIFLHEMFDYFNLEGSPDEIEIGETGAGGGLFIPPGDKGEHSEILIGMRTLCARDNDAMKYVDEPYWKSIGKMVGTTAHESAHYLHHLHLTPEWWGRIHWLHRELVADLAKFIYLDQTGDLPFYMDHLRSDWITEQPAYELFQNGFGEKEEFQHFVRIMFGGTSREYAHRWKIRHVMGEAFLEDLDRKREEAGKKGVL